jgi:FKBP-type peptidyl-prolyl cis-trans isomerase
MKKFLLIICLLILTLSFIGCKKNDDQSAESGDTNESTDDGSVDIDIEKFSYSLGVSIGGSLKNISTDIDIDTLAKAIKDVFAEKQLTVSADDAEQYIQESITTLRTAEAAKAKKKGDDFLAENKSKKGVVTTESGLQYIVLKETEGPKPEAMDKVSVHYTGTFIDESVFDSSVDRGEPLKITVSQVIPGWSEGLQLMSTGSKYKFFIPSNLGYGPQGAGDVIGPNEVLIFEVELLEIIKEET